MYGTNLAVVNAGGGMLAAVSEMTVINFYLAYTVTAVSLVVFLARTLNRNGKVFLEDSFDQPELAQSVNQLLVVGFYLLNLGYALLVYQLKPSYETLTLAFNELVVKIGILLLSLGVIHMLNMLVFWKIRSARGQTRDRGGIGSQLPPASAFVPPPPMASTAAGSGYPPPAAPGQVMESYTP